MNRLAVIVPSRGRPDNASRLARTVWAPAAKADLIFAIDEDDPKREWYIDLLRGQQTWHFPGHPTMIQKLNWSAQPLATAGDYAYLGFMGDDHLPRTDGWDSAVIGALDAMDGPGIVYCDDGFQGENLPTAVFMHAEIVRRLGWFALPTVRHLYCDNAWLDLGRALGNVTYLPDVLIEHLHPHAGKADSDDQYERVNGDEAAEADRRAWLTWRETQLAVDVATIQRVPA